MNPALFPNRHLPVRADLFNRVAWQLRNRAGVKVWAALPMQAAELTREKATPANISREQLLEVYEDLARHAIVDGVWFKGDASDDIVEEWTATLRAIRGPQLQTASSFSTSALRDAAQNWLIASPASSPSQTELNTLVDTLAAHPGALDKTVVMLPAHGVSTAALAAQMQTLQQRGVRHFGYGTDGFRQGQPALADLIPAFSTGWYPFVEGRDE